MSIHTEAKKAFLTSGYTTPRTVFIDNPFTVHIQRIAKPLIYNLKLKDKKIIFQVAQNTKIAGLFQYMADVDVYVITLDKTSIYKLRDLAYLIAHELKHIAQHVYDTHDDADYHKLGDKHPSEKDARAYGRYWEKRLVKDNVVLNPVAKNSPMRRLSK